MCGVVGYAGPDPACDIVMGGLRRLEYRGYDSAGIAFTGAGQIEIHKQAGKIAALADLLANAPVTSLVHHATTAVGHTRWATHGAPTTINAHPHVDCGGDIAVVHNGIIENHAALRSELAAAGHVFRSDTDTEVFAHLVESELRTAGGDRLASAVRAALKRIEGSYAFVVASAAHPDRLVAARSGSPLVVGLSGGATLVASDIPALLAHTRDVIVIDDGCVVDITPGQAEVTDLGGLPIEAAMRTVAWDLESAEKGGHPHFMLKEMHEQPTAVAETLRGRVQSGKVILDDLRISEDSLRAVSKVFVVACGTSYHAGLVAKSAIERWTRLPVEIDIASEFRYRDPVVDDRTLVIGVSQSGESIDTLAAFRHARALGARTVAVCNVVDSSMAREADAVLYTHAGPEICVAATKTFTAQMAAMQVLALYLAQVRGTLNESDFEAIKSALEGLPELMAAAIESSTGAEGAEEVATHFDGTRDVFFLGRGIGYAMALEGALKLKELAYVRAEGYPAGELKHGPIALIEPGVLVVAVAMDSPLKAKLLSNVAEVKARGATVVMIGHAGDSEVAAMAEHVLVVPRSIELLSPLVGVIPLQFLAYHMAIRRGHDVDQPRNLAKTVTVE